MAITDKAPEVPTMSEIFVREAEPEDIESLQKLIIKSTGGKTKLTAANLYNDLFKVPGTDALEISETDPCIELEADVFKTNQPMMQALVVGKSNQLVGYLLFHYYWAPWIGKMALIDDIFILKGLDGSDISKRLLQKVHEHGKIHDLKMMVFSVAEKRPDYLEIISNSDLKVLRDNKTDWSIYRVPMQKS